MRGVNKTIIVGSMGRDPEMSATQNGRAMARLSIATNEEWKDKQTGEKQSRTEWHQVIFFDKLAEIIGQYAKKGTLMYVEGSNRTSKWQDKETGADRYSTNIMGKEFQFLGGKDSGNPKVPQPSLRDAGPPITLGSRDDLPPQRQAAPPQAGVFTDFDDDIPFS